MREIIVDNFAGGGGASTGIEMALGISPDVAINHDAEAVAMHEANHPMTLHLRQKITAINPYEVMPGRVIGLLWASPDCKHFSKAKGATPVQKNIRDLAWTVVAWAETRRPRVIVVENVEEFTTWGPLVETPDGMRPDPERKGETFQEWVRRLKAVGYDVDWRELKACDYGTPTIRKRLFIIARCDGQPIVWPAPTHGPGRALPWRTAAECIDWSIPVPSIFGRSRPLAEATLRRIARGIQRFVLDAAEPFLVPITHGGPSNAHNPRCNSIREPLRTLTTQAEHALVAPFLAPRYTERDGQEPRCQTVDAPLPTVVTTANGARLCAAFLAQHNTGVVGHPVTKPVSTLTTSGSHQQLVAAFLTKYYGTAAEGADLAEPMHTVTTRDRFGLVTIRGVDYEIVDIGMRMLTPRELFLAQGFPPNYIIEAMGPDGKLLTKTAQIRMCGNSVCPPLAAAVVRANYSVRESADVIPMRPRRRKLEPVGQEVLFA